MKSSGMQIRLSDWIKMDHAATRVIFGTDPEIEDNRIAFIEKTPRVRLPGNPPNDIKAGICDGWLYGPKGSGQLCGEYPPSRAWADQKLRELGYFLD